MRIPDPLFPLVNRVVAGLLHSPLHGLMSGNVMVIHFTGRKTGKPRWTPVRYLHCEAGGVFCLTGRETGWWHNFAGEAAGAPAALRLAGEQVAAKATAEVEDAALKEAALRRMLAAFPADAPYHGIVAKRGEAPSDEQIRQAVARDVLVTFALEDQSASA